MTPTSRDGYTRLMSTYDRVHSDASALLAECDWLRQGMEEIAAGHGRAAHVARQYLARGFR